MIVRQVYVYAFRIGLIRSFLPFRVVSLFCVIHLHALSGEKKEPGEPYRLLLCKKIEKTLILK